MSEVPFPTTSPDDLALRRAQELCGAALAAYRTEPEQLAAQFETDRVCFSFRGQGCTASSGSLHSVGEYIRTERMTEIPNEKDEHTPFHVSA